MNIFASTKSTTIAIILGIVTILYMTPNKVADIAIPTIDYSNAISMDKTESNSPEPATMLLFGTGLAGFAGIIRRKKK